jgi:hypothetical protein
MTVDLDNGKQAVVNRDLGKLWLQLFANRGSLGVELTPEQAEEIGLILWQMGRRARRAKPQRPPEPAPE